jgi:hypothetical protein
MGWYSYRVGLSQSIEEIGMTATTVQAVEALVAEVDALAAAAKKADQAAKEAREALLATLKAGGLLVKEEDGGIRFRGVTATVTLVQTARESFISVEEAMERKLIAPRFIRRAAKFDAGMIRALEAAQDITPEQVVSLRDGDPRLTESLRISRPSK